MVGVVVEEEGSSDSGNEAPKPGKKEEGDKNDNSSSDEKASSQDIGAGQRRSSRNRKNRVNLSQVFRTEESTEEESDDDDEEEEGASKQADVEISQNSAAKKNGKRRRGRPVKRSGSELKRRKSESRSKKRNDKKKGREDDEEFVSEESDSDEEEGEGNEDNEEDYDDEEESGKKRSSSKSSKDDDYSSKGDSGNKGSSGSGQTRKGKRVRKPSGAAERIKKHQQHMERKKALQELARDRNTTVAPVKQPVVPKKPTVQLSESQRKAKEAVALALKAKLSQTSSATKFRTSSSGLKPRLPISKTPIKLNTGQGETSKESAKRTQKRPKLRKQSNANLFPNSPDLTPPARIGTNWNASEIIKGFLFVGAGWDQNQRCLVNRKNDDPGLKASRLSWCRSRNMCYALNMAGSPLQKELHGISYILPETKFVRIDMNDLDTWNEEEMVKGFERGSEFIEEAWKANKEARALHGNPNVQVKIVPPTVFVHCVAGVNRSPMCVVWWLCRYHGLHIRDAWDLVRTRRDIGAHWTNVTLGGVAPPEGYVPAEVDRGQIAPRKFQHCYEGSEKTSTKLGPEAGVDGPTKNPEEPVAAKASAEPKATEDKPLDNKLYEIELEDCEEEILEEEELLDDGVKPAGAGGNNEKVTKGTDEKKVDTVLPISVKPEFGEGNSAGSTTASASSVITESTAAWGKSEADTSNNADGEKKKVEYPKALWFINSERLLQKYFKRRVSPLTGCSSPVMSPSASPMTVPPLANSLLLPPQAQPTEKQN
mmetsp:Transcript_21027/g.34307  ORF Transcript_21027/g.34307 Transcript_21027/m.34307 type:complete len:767 (-) Transcript_21027:2525-4825(-)